MPVGQPQPSCFWSTFWSVSALFAARLPASELFDCSTLPLSPGLWIRTEMLLLLGLYCSEVAFESAFWPVRAIWPAACSPAPDPAWVTACWVEALFTAPETAAELLLCETEPLSPGLKIRTSMLLLLGFVCVDDADELADWPVPAICSTPWTDCAWATPDPMTRSTASAPKSAIRCLFTSNFLRLISSDTTGRYSARCLAFEVARRR